MKRYFRLWLINSQISTDFKYVEPIPSHLECSLCSCPLFSPVEHVECGTEFCESCVQSLRDCPTCKAPGNYRPITSRRLLEPLNDLNVFCPTCAHVVKRAAYTSHLEKCAVGNENSYFVSIVVCQFGCSAVLSRSGLEDHALVCEKRRVHCKGSDLMCTWTGTVAEQATHQNTCIFVQLQPLLQTILQVQLKSTILTISRKII